MLSSDARCAADGRIGRDCEYHRVLRCFGLYPVSALKDSQEILSQLNIAVGAGLMVVTLRVDEAYVSEQTRYYLADAHWLDARTPPYEEKLKMLCGWVKDRLKKKPGRKTKYAKKLRLKNTLWGWR